MAYKAVVLPDTILNPYSIASHHVGHHDISEQSIPDYGHLILPCHSSLRLAAEILHDFGVTSGFLGTVSQDFYSRVAFE